MKAYSVCAAALAVLALGTLHSTASPACTDGRCVQQMAAAGGKPLQLVKQKSTARAVIKKSQRKKGAKTPKKAKGEEPATTTDTNAATDAPNDAVSANRSEEEALPVVVVRTTREPNNEPPVPIVSADELNDLDRAAIPASLLASTIANYLGRPDITDEFDAPVTVSVEDFSSEAKQAFAAATPPQQPTQVALEYILMTFGGALAAASAIRLFVV
jgi:hypothetical protein